MSTKHDPKAVERVARCLYLMYYPFKYYDGMHLPPEEIPDVPWEKLADFNQDEFRMKARELMSAMLG